MKRQHTPKKKLTLVSEMHTYLLKICKMEASANVVEALNVYLKEGIFPSWILSDQLIN